MNEPDVTASTKGSDKLLEYWKSLSLLTRVWYVVAIASVVLNLAAMVLAGPVFAVVSGIIALLIAPAVGYLQSKLEDTDTLRTVQNQLRVEVNRLSVENLKLSAEVTKLEGQVGRLKSEEGKLDAISKEQGTNVENLLNLVKENQTTLDGLKVAVKAELSQVLVSAVIESDFDSSGHFTEDEIEILVMRVSNVPGVRVNAELLKQKANESDRTLGAILCFLDHLDSKDLPDQERIFEMDEEHLPRY